MTKDPVLEKKCKSSYRIVRGGGWLYSPDNLLSNHRDGISPGNRSDSVSFRPVRSSKEKP
jgi:formylglycine-generating enzyme required for sulfatase activity